MLQVNDADTLEWVYATVHTPRPFHGVAGWANRHLPPGGEIVAIDVDGPQAICVVLYRIPAALVPLSVRQQWIEDAGAPTGSWPTSRG